MPILNIKLPKEKEYLQPCVNAFNTLCERGLYPSIIKYSYFELYKAYPDIDVSLWKEFQLDPNVNAWYTSERQLALKTQVSKLIDEAGSSKSTASAQTLNTLLKQVNEMEESTTNQQIIVYMSVPMTENERKAQNVQSLSKIPDAIGDAIQTIKRRTNN